ncbi:MAG: DUF4317 domain-containing protein [Lachnospiraceae bacterium]|nr:DUF4317 domain-containing protein [Lachnospiraceae bacterium]
MTKKDILELKKRLNKTDCSITKLCGCYVDGNQNKVLTFSETFLNLDDEEFYKYLDLSRKCLSGTVGNNLLQLDFPAEEEAPGGRQQFLMGIKESGLKNEELLERFYDLVIEHYDFAGNYLILLFKDAYDVITKTNDGLKLDESEEVFDYLLCAICPVTLSKPGLGYREEENRIGARVRDWVVGAPDTGFIFPAFSDRSSDIHSLIYYIKDTKDSRPDFVEHVLGCGSKRTATEEQQIFSSIVKQALAPVRDDCEEVLLQLQESFQDITCPEEDEIYEEPEPVILTGELVDEVLAAHQIKGEAAQHIRDGISREFDAQPPVLQNLIDEKALEKNAKKKEEEQLRLQVQNLQKELAEKTFLSSGEEAASDDTSDDISAAASSDVVLRVRPEKAPLIKSEIIDGQKCLIIPVEEDEQVNVNGVDTIL